ncbi:hypothetical protein MC04F16_30190 [Escherichia coli]
MRGRATKLRKDAKPINPDDFDGNFIRELEPIFDSRGRKRFIEEHNLPHFVEMEVTE